MRLQLPYGDSTIDATVPDTATVLLPAPSTPVADPDAAVLAAILDPIDSPPLAKLVQPGQKACIVVSDVTRPVPNAVLLPPILHTLESGGIETREEYRSHHLPADIQFARAVPSQEGPLTVRVRGDVAWATSTSVTQGTYRDRQINSAGAELMVLTRTAGGWKIAAIHWSSRQRR